VRATGSSIPRKVTPLVAIDPRLTTLTRGKVNSLHDLTPAEQANTILYSLAIQLGYPTLDAGDVQDIRRTIVADPDEVLQKALETIWKYEELSS